MQAVPPASYEYGNQAAYQPGYAQPGYSQSGYAQPEYGGYPQQQWPDQSAPKKRSKAIPILVVVLILVVLGGVGLGVYLYQHNKSVTAAPPPPAVGACLNQQLGQPVKMVTANCSNATYQVVQVFRGTSNQDVCNSVSGVTTFYTFSWPPNSADDYVLCLRSPG
jgi:hypothetical protein